MALHQDCHSIAVFCCRLSRELCGKYVRGRIGASGYTSDSDCRRVCLAADSNRHHLADYPKKATLAKARLDSESLFRRSVFSFRCAILRPDRPRNRFGRNALRSMVARNTIVCNDYRFWARHHARDVALHEAVAIRFLWTAPKRPSFCPYGQMTQATKGRNGVYRDPSKHTMRAQQRKC